MQNFDDDAVEILLATFNGDKYLEAQLDSLLSQSYTKIFITVRDDGSTDSTLDIIKRYVQDYPSKVALIEDDGGGGSACHNFSILLSHSKARYIMCCDQDDVWHSDKVHYFLKQIKFYEGVFGEDRPILFHCDLTVTDESLQVLNPSLWNYQNIKPAWGKKFNLLLTQNSVTGCSSIANRPLLSIALPVPNQAVLHDWWLALVACSMGVIVSDTYAPTYYRQHGKNVVGAVMYTLRPSWSLLKKIFDRQNMRNSLILEARQAKEFSVRFENIPDALIAKTFSDLPFMSPLEKRTRIARHGFRKMGFWRNVSWLLRI